MFGFEIDEIELRPVEIDDTVFVPVYTKNGGSETATYLPYEELQDRMDDEDSLGTDDFRYDP